MKNIINYLFYGAVALLIIAVIWAFFFTALDTRQSDYDLKCESRGGTGFHAQGLNLCIKKETVVDIPSAR